MVIRVTSSTAGLVLRPPLWARVWAAGFPFLFLGVLLLGVRPEGPARPIALGMVVLVCLLAWRLFRVAAVGTADGTLLVRNHLRDHTLDRSDIREVSVARLRGGTGNLTVQLALQDGSTVGLAVTEVPFRAFFGRRLERDADGVRAWVSGHPQPYR
jgi:hypothetical protein